MRHEREGECGEEEDEEDEERRRKEGEIRCLVLTDFCRLIPPDPPSILHPSRFLFRFNLLCFHFAAVDLFTYPAGLAMESSLDQHRPRLETGHHPPIPATLYRFPFPSLNDDTACLGVLPLLPPSL